jgi:hypothetical protein
MKLALAFCLQTFSAMYISGYAEVHPYVSTNHRLAGFLAIIGLWCGQAL